MPPKKQIVKVEPLAFLGTHPFVRDAVIDRIFGCIFGSALGDTIGLYTEFMDKAQIARVYPPKKHGHPKFQLIEPATKLHPDAHRTRFAPRAWTDDTDQALLILLSYLYSYTHAPAGHSPGTYARSQLPLDFAARLQVWIRRGLLALSRPGLGIGRLVGSVVSAKNYLHDPVAAATKAWIKGGYKDAPNGSLMRTHPIGIIGIGLNEEETWNLAVRVGHTTHVDPRCSVACCVLVALIRGLLRGEITDIEDVGRCIERSYAFVLADSKLMNPGNTKVQTMDVKSRLHRKDFERYAYATELEDLALDEPGKIGYVYKCLGSAIWALRSALSASEGGHPALKLAHRDTDTFEKLTTALVLEGGDADTNAAAACAVLGAYLGYAKLPAHWTKGLSHGAFLDLKTQRLIKVLGIVGFIPEIDLEGNEAIYANGQWRERERPWEERVADQWVVKKMISVADGEGELSDSGLGEWLEKKKDAVGKDEEKALSGLGKRQWEEMKKRVAKLVIENEEASDEDSSDRVVDGEDRSDLDDQSEDEDEDEDNEEGEAAKAVADAQTKLLKAIAADVRATTHQEYAAQSKASMDKAIAEATGKKMKEHLMKMAGAREATEKALKSVGKVKTEAAEKQDQQTPQKVKTNKRKADAEVGELESETQGGSKANTKKTRVEPKVIVKKEAETKKPETKKEKQQAEGERKNKGVKTGQRVVRSTRIANQKKK